jgi:poly(hydroxyalkanoate) granule-associated protein
MDYQEIEVEVRQIEQGQREPLPPLFDLTRQLVLAGIGAVAATRDAVAATRGEVVQTLEQARVRGEAAQREGEQAVRSFFGQGRQRREQRQQRMARLFEDSVERVLGRFNIPSQRDIDELNARVARLSARLEELNAREPRAES